MKRECDSATLSKLAYEAPGQFKLRVENLGYKYIDYIDEDDMQAYLVECEQGQTLIFRGSELDFGDWIRNLVFWLKDTYIGNCHKGYFDILVKSYDKLISKITDRNLLVTGHSQGAGLAIIFSKLYNVTENAISSFFVFEPPRITDDKNFHNRGFFTVNGGDIVSRLPLLSLGYRHTGNMIYYSRIGRCYINPRWMFRFLDNLADLINDDLLEQIDDNLTDHYITPVEHLTKKNWGKIKKYINKL